MTTAVMGIVNVTPDSFSDGGRYFSPDQALARARKMVAEGAAFLDLGGESTRPGATPLGWEEEWRRIEPVLAGLADGACRRPDGARVTISVDTYHPETVERALAAGATMINCVSETTFPAMIPLCRRHRAALVGPAACFEASGAVARALEAAALPAVYRDPMIGFGTTRAEDFARLRAVPDLAKKGRVLVGASRKRIVKKLTGEKVTGKNLGGNVGLAVWCALHGADIVRVHDVRETVQALRVVEALSRPPVTA